MNHYLVSSKLIRDIFYIYINMQNIKELFDTATYGEIVETELVKPDTGSTPMDTEYVSIYTDRLRKRPAEEPLSTGISLDIDSMLLLEETGLSRKKIKYSDDIERLSGFNELSPDSKTIVLAESVSNRQSLINDIMKDNIKIDSIIKKLDSMDDDYSYTLASEVGNFMELWICANMKCPGCKKGKLFKYISSNMPVIDIRCDNPEHNLLHHGPLFYQVKATEKNTNFLGTKYFTRQPIKDYPSGYIKVGSKKLGQFSHSVSTVESIENKYIVIGYICITYTYSTNRRLINIDLNDSFVVIPNLAFQARTRTNDYYYKYIPNSLNLSMISFNPDTNIVNVLSFNDLASKDGYSLGLFKNINLDKKYTTRPYIKPTSATRKLDLSQETMNYQAKYLYYKNKYIKLKYNMMII